MSRQNYWIYLVTIGIIVLLIPVGLIFFEVITTSQESVTIEIDTSSPIELLAVMLYLLLFLVVLTIGVYRGYVKVRELLNLRREKMNIELLHLQSQINPHFFFNVLNRLYGTIERSPEEAKEMVMILSGMMRYSIYDGQNEKITLHNEIEYLKKYIQLNQSRYHKQSEIRFESEVEDDAIEITPLMLIILLENAFKHGVEKLTKDAFVYIKLTSSGKEVMFEIENNFDPDEVSVNAGMGLKNLKQRLVLAYPKKHKLEINQTDSVFKATLKLNLV